MMHHMSMMTIDQPPPPQSWTWSWWPLTNHHHHNHNHEHDDRRPATITTIHHMNMLTIDPPPPPQSWTWTCRPLSNHHNGQLAFQNHLFFYQKWTIAFLLNTEKAVWHCFCLKTILSQIIGSISSVNDIYDERGPPPCTTSSCNELQHNQESVICFVS